MNKLNPRVWTLISIGLVVLALILLSASLNSLQLDPGSPLPVGQMAPNLVDEGSPSEFGRILMAIVRVVIIIGWLLLPFYIIYLILSKEARKRFLRDMMIYMPLLILLYVISTNSNNREVAMEINPGLSAENLEEFEGPISEPLPEFVEPPGWVTTVTSLILAVALTLLIGGLVFLSWRRSRGKALEPLRMVEKEAQAALDAIEAGGDIRDAIMRCYYQMLKALSEYKNIHRGRDVTPHEFETFLQQRGIPAEPVHQLTQLFEQVRYGAITPGRQEERIAISSLSAIVNACQRSRMQQNGA